MTQPSELRARVSARFGDFSLDVDLKTEGGPLVIVGPNGAGKTTLLSCILGVLPVREGCVAVGEKILFDAQARVFVPVEDRRFAYVPQDYALFPHLSVRENVAFAARSSARRGRPQRADTHLERLGLLPLRDRSVDTLSGGEKQRVAIARALAIDPLALLLDEPLSALDVHAKKDVREFLTTLLRELGLPAIVISHDPEDARTLATTIAVLEAGRVTQRGTWSDLARAPASPFIAELVASPSPARASLP